MTDRGLSSVDAAAACPFVALEDDRDGRALAPDRRHRCYAEAVPAPRALAHQEAYCLSSAFAVCPTFQDWARREAAALRSAPPEARPARDEPPPSRPQPRRELEPPQSRPVPRRELEPRRLRPSDPPGASSPGRHRRDWAAPPPWAAGGEDPGSADEPRSFLAARERDLEQRRDTAARGLAGSPADRVAGPDRDLPRPPVPEAPGRGRPLPPPEPAEDEDLDVGWPPEPVRPVGRPFGRTPVDLASLDRPPLDRPSFDREPADRPGAAAAPSRGPDRPMRPEWADRRRPADREDRGDRDDRSDWLDRSARPDRPGPADRPVRQDRLEPTDRPDRTSGAGAGRPPQVSRRESSHRRREEEVVAELFGPAWERPHRFEAYPSLRTRVGLPSIPGIVIGALALVLAGAILFFGGPMLLGLGSKPVAPSPSPTATPTATPAPTPTPGPTPQAYVIAKGDTMSKIAARFGVTLEALLAANPQLKDPNKIVEGDQLTIPVPMPTELPNVVVGSNAPSTLP